MSATKVFTATINGVPLTEAQLQDGLKQIASAKEADTNRRYQLAEGVLFRPHLFRDRVYLALSPKVGYKHVWNVIEFRNERLYKSGPFTWTDGLEDYTVLSSAVIQSTHTYNSF